MKSDLIVRALKIAAARDDLLAARERRKQARLAWAEACGDAQFMDEDHNFHNKFALFENDYPDGYYGITSRYAALRPESVTGELAATDPDFIAWCASGKEKYEANKAHGIALRRLLQIGVKK